MKIFLSLLLSLAASVAVAAGPQVALDTNQGRIVLQLDADKAPRTVENFVAYVASGHYNGTIFHRVIDGFMIQGGGFDPAMKQKPTNAAVKNEADNGLRNETGTIAMARTRNPHSATAQFFINVNNNVSLDHSAPTAAGYGYAVFGRVVDGMDVVQRIAKLPTTRSGMHADVPREPVVIEKATLLPTQR